MSTVIVMVSVSDRVESLNRFLTTLHDRFDDTYPVHIHLQDPDKRRSEISVPLGLPVQMQVTDTPIGCHAARVMALREIHGFDTYINVDDDVLVMPTTDYDPAVRYSQLPGVGFVLTNWCQHRSQYEDRKHKMNPVFTPQIMVYNGGGMAYDNDLADLIRDLDPIPARYDDIWPMTSYLSGRMNYRYSGSLSLHLIRSKGGMSSYMRAEPRPLLCQEWIDYRHIAGARVGVDYAIGMDSDVKESAKEIHRARRIEQGWPMRTPKYAAHPTLEDVHGS